MPLHTVRKWIPTAAGKRLALALVLAVLTLPLSLQLSPSVRLLTAWNVGAWSLLAMTWVVIATSSAIVTRLRSAAEDPGRLLVHVIVLLTTVLSLIASMALLRARTSVALDQRMFHTILSLATVVGAWLLNHTSWTLRYAHLYYREDHEGVGGLLFPGDLAPDDLDFAYFSFTIGICMQTSDVVVTSPQFRRSVLLHALQSFAFNTAIIALLLNVVFGLISG